MSSHNEYYVNSCGDPKNGPANRIERLRARGKKMETTDDLRHANRRRRRGSIHHCSSLSGYCSRSSGCWIAPALPAARHEQIEDDSDSVRAALNWADIQDRSTANTRAAAPSIRYSNSAERMVHRIAASRCCRDRRAQMPAAYSPAANRPNWPLHLSHRAIPPGYASPVRILCANHHPPAPRRANWLSPAACCTAASPFAARQIRRGSPPEVYCD